jgi:hypothetical protein
MLRFDRKVRMSSQPGLEHFDAYPAKTQMGTGYLEPLRSGLLVSVLDIGDAGGFINQSLVFFSPACS